MLFTNLFVPVIAIASTLVLPAVAGPTVARDEVALFNWLARTDANIIYTGAKPGSIAARGGANVNVVTCTSRSGDVCGGTCTVYNGPATCLKVDGTACLQANYDVSFCDHNGCSGSCNQLSSCGTKLAGGFCDTPGTKSVTVPFIDV